MPQPEIFRVMARFSPPAAAAAAPSQRGPRGKRHTYKKEKYHVQKIRSITPPVGSVLFVGCGIGHVSIEQVTSKLIPYFVALVAALLAVTYIPALSLGLPSLMGLI